MSVHAVRVLRGFSALAAAAVLVMCMQAAYSAVVSRILLPAAFGGYAAAVALGGLTALVAAAALGQAAARRQTPTVGGDRTLFGLSLVVGMAGSGLTLLLAPAWCRIWGLPNDTAVIRLVAVGLPFASLASVASGVMRREGRTVKLAAMAGGSQALGLAVGLAFVIAVRQTWTVSVSLVAGQVVMATLLLTSMRPIWRSMPGRWRDVDQEAISYVARAAPLDVLRYLTSSVPLWAIGRYAGPDVLGATNRGLAVITAPLAQLQAAFTTALFPELRPGGPVTRNPAAFTDLMILLSTVSAGILGIGVFFAPTLLQLILGQGWPELSSIARLALLVGVIPIVGVPVMNALEATGRFAASGVGWLIGAVAVGVGTLLTARTGSFLPAMLAMVGAAGIPAFISVLAASRRGLINWHVWWRGVRFLFALQGIVSILLAGASAMAKFGISGGVILAASLSVGVIEIVILAWMRDRLVAFQIARRYGLVPGRDRLRAPASHS